MSKYNDFAIETLVTERDLFVEKIGIKKSEMKFYNRDADEELEQWKGFVVELDAGISKLQGGVPGNGRKPPKNPAKCNNGKSVGWCSACCPKRKDRTCQLISFRKKKEA